MATSSIPAERGVRVIVSLLFAAFLCGCGGGSGGGVTTTLGPAPRVNPKVPTVQSRKLVFEVQPTSGLAGRPFPTAIRVGVVDQNNRRVTWPIEVTLQPVNPANRAKVEGTLTVDAQAGVAEFDDVAVMLAARNMVFEATAPGLQPIRSTAFYRDVSAARRHVILMVADGWGYQHIAAARSYTGKSPVYKTFDHFAMSHWDTNVLAVNGSPAYDPKRAWSEFGYLTQVATDSASAATALFTGTKTNSGRISVGPGPNPERLTTISELAIRNGLGSGAVSSVPLSHATPGAWCAHNISRGNALAIMDEALFGDPKATSGGAGSFGTTPIPHVLIGGAHPVTAGGTYVSQAQLARARSGGIWTVVDRFSPTTNQELSSVVRLQQAAADPKTERLFGLFGGGGGNLPYRLADGSGANPEEPTLAQMSTAALQFLERQPRGFFLVVEGGAVDWASHSNNMNQMVGEMIGFNAAVASVVDWVEDPTNGSNWSNTLVIVTGDHETGLLTAGPSVFPDKPLGAVTAQRMAAERAPLNKFVTASWDDLNQNGMIDPGEKVHWAWNSYSHSNTLIPCFSKGIQSGRFQAAATGTDPVRGQYIDNTDVYKVMLEVLRN